MTTTGHPAGPDDGGHRAGREEIADLVSRYFRSLDEREFDAAWARAYFTPDVRSVTPVGTAEGAEEIVRHTARALGRFARTQHMSADVVVDAAGDGRTARVGWNALMTHVHREETLRARGADADPVFTVGGHWQADAVRTADGRRFAGIVIEPLWTRGQPPEIG